MQHQQLAAVGGLMDRLAPYLDAAEAEAGELAEHLVMIAGDIDDAGAAPGPLHQAPDDVIVRGGPVEAALQTPAVDDVAHQVHGVAVDAVEEIDQHPRIAAPRAQVNVRNPDRRSEERRGGKEGGSTGRTRGW